MSDTNVQDCNCCGYEDDCIDGLCQQCSDYNYKLQKQSETKQCKDCKWFWVSEKDEFGTSTLECRRYAPRILHGSGAGWSDTKFPKINHDDWCGEWRKKWIQSKP